MEEEDRLADEKEQELLKQRPEWMKAKQKYLKSNKYNLLMRVPKVGLGLGLGLGPQGALT